MIQMPFLHGKSFVPGANGRLPRGQTVYCMSGVLLALSMLLLPVGFVSAQNGGDQEHAVAMDVGILAELGASIRFEPFNATRLLPYELFSGILTVHNNSSQTIEFKKNLMLGSSVALIVYGPDGSAIEYPSAGIGGRYMGPVMVTLEPGESLGSLIQLSTSGTPLRFPGTFTVAVALVEHGTLKAENLAVTIIPGTASDEAVFAAMSDLTPGLDNPVAISYHLALDPDPTYMSRIEQIVLANPTSRYGADLAKGLADYRKVVRTGDREPLLRIAAEYGGRVVSGRASLDLAHLMFAEERYEEAAQWLQGLEEAVDSRVSTMAAQLLERLAPVLVSPRLGVQISDATPAPRPLLDLSPAALRQRIQDEGAEIVQVLDSYYVALIVTDAPGLASVSGLSEQEANELLTEFSAELSEKGIGSIVSVSLPPVTTDGYELLPLDTQGILFSVRVTGITIVVEQNGFVQTLRVTRQFRFSRDSDSRWVMRLR